MYCNEGESSIAHWIKACVYVCVCVVCARVGPTNQPLPGSSLVALLAEQALPGLRLLELHALSGPRPVPLPAQPAVDEPLGIRRVPVVAGRRMVKHTHVHM